MLLKPNVIAEGERPRTNDRFGGNVRGASRNRGGFLLIRIRLVSGDRVFDTEKTKQFLKNNIRSAQWFIDAIAQRKGTLLKVAKSIVAHQKEFFDKGQLFLKPLPMSKIADELGIHIATVSRAVAGKYMQSPQGILPLRRFFAGGIQTEDGKSRSWHAVRAKLQQIVEQEDKTKPLSDDEIRKKMAETGFHNIARRTVAKYRRLLNIPTARFRKKYKGRK